MHIQGPRTFAVFLWLKNAFHGRAAARRLCASLLLTLLCSRQATAQQAAAGGSQTWTTETLANGLRVIYTPMANVPTNHVRVFYHVGSRDERPDRQGFAHMFEHMMFRGSAHVAPQEHMRLIGLVGGYSNAHTGFDDTNYEDTQPASYTQLALWLEADRMASFKVSPQIFVTERLVVGEEWRMRLNQPYGGMYDELMPAMFKVHPYRWTPIGNMQHLQAARAGELQDFFNKYYVPNNAILTITGNIDIEKTKTWVHQYFGWIPGGDNEIHMYPADGGPHLTTFGPVARNIPVEPLQTEPRRLEMKMSAPLPRVLLTYHMPPAASDDVDALGLLLAVLGDGQSSRLYRTLVSTDNPLCVGADSLMDALEDGGIMGVAATVLPGKDVADVEKVLRAQIADIRSKPVTAEELEKVKQQERLNLAQRFETPSKVAEELGYEMLIRGNLDRVATARARLEAISVADLQRVAQKYLPDNGVTTMVITPGTPPPAALQAAGVAGTAPASAPADNQPTPATSPARAINFPADFPTKAPSSGALPAAVFEKGTVIDVAIPGASAPVQVIVMEDHRMPIINWSLTLRSGSEATPTGKEGLASLSAEMVRRGPKGKTFDQFNEELESRAISLSVADGNDIPSVRNGDTTWIGGSCLKEQFSFGLNATKQMLLTPAFDEGEFGRLKDQTLSGLSLALDNPQTLASRALARAIWGDLPMGRISTIKSVTGITLDDVKQFYNRIYHLDGAILLISGDISVADGQTAAKNFLSGLPVGDMPKVDYTLPKPAASRQILLVDHPSSRQSSIRMGLQAYTIASDEKFVGSLANQMLSAGIDSRLGKYVRAEKGYVYGVQGVFMPARQSGVFVGQTDTKFSTTADTVEAMFKVFDDMKAANVPEQELAESKSRVAGGLLMSMQTLSDQASYRVTGMLNHYPIDYYDKYAQRIGQITADQVRAVVNKYIDENRMTIVVVGPAETLKPQLERLGPVKVIPAAND